VSLTASAGNQPWDGKIKAPPPDGRMWLVRLKIFDAWRRRPAGASVQNINDFNASSAIPGIAEGAASHDDAGR
jgi:hypothetical protein